MKQQEGVDTTEAAHEQGEQASSKGRCVDITLPPIDDAAVERITPKRVRKGQRVDSHRPPSTTPLQEVYTPNEG